MESRDPAKGDATPLSQNIPRSYAKGYDGEGIQSPFSDEIKTAIYLKGLDSRDLPKYDGSQDP